LLRFTQPISGLNSPVAACLLCCSEEVVTATHSLLRCSSGCLRFAYHSSILRWAVTLLSHSLLRQFISDLPIITLYVVKSLPMLTPLLLLIFRLYSLASKSTLILNLISAVCENLICSLAAHLTCSARFSSDTSSPCLNISHALSFHASMIPALLKVICD